MPRTRARPCGPRGTTRASRAWARANPMEKDRMFTELDSRQQNDRASTADARPATSTAMLTVAVVGLGYVGLPLAVEFGKVMKTVGFDVSQRKVEAYRNKV